jgi:predicted O-linked N-acetylglucosamine transferase (SPINDLY family)
MVTMNNITNDNITLAQAYHYYNHGRYIESGHICQQLIASSPTNHEAFFLCGLAIYMLGQYQPAANLISRAIAINPNIGKYYHKLSLCLLKLHMLGAAVNVAQEAIKLEPNNCDYYNDLGACLIKLCRFTEAIELYQKVVKLEPSINHYTNLALSLYKNCQYKEVEEVYQEFLRTNPNPIAKIPFLYMLLPSIYESNEHILNVRKELTENIDDILKDKAFFDNKNLNIRTILNSFFRLPNFYLAYHAINNKDIAVKIYELFEAAFPQLLYKAPKLATYKQGEPIKIGFVSSYFYSHAVSTCFNGIIQGISKNDNFKTFVFTHKTIVDDSVNDILKGHINFFELPESLSDVHSLIVSQELDVLVYTDLGLDERIHALALARLAPIQCCLPGHPDTTGLATIDYFISSSKMEPANADEHYSEKLALIENIPAYVNKPELPEITLTKEKLGFTQDSVLYLCPMISQKVHPDFDKIIEDILNQVPNSVVLFIENRAEPTMSDSLKKRIHSHLPELKDRIIFLPWFEKSDFLQLLSIVDTVLDTPYFSGGTTSYYVFATGTPIVTVEGEFLRGRVTSTCYNEMGITGLTATDIEGYINIAVELGKNPALRASKKAEILKQNAILYEDKRVIKEFINLFINLARENVTKYNLLHEQTL